MKVMDSKDFAIFEELKLRNLQRELQVGVDALAREDVYDAKDVFDELLDRH